MLGKLTKLFNILVIRSIIYILGLCVLCCTLNSQILFPPLLLLC